MSSKADSTSTDAFRFVDLFAGIGGFHAALASMGGQCVYAVEIDREASAVYRRNWGVDPLGDLVADTALDPIRVPEHEVLAAGFPCQPFSKSGLQRGMDEARGTLFWNILRVLEVRRPSVVMLENVRNIAGPRHAHEWKVIIRSLRELGYQVSSTPVVLSPHLLPPALGGAPQVRERVFILGVYVGTEESFVDVNPQVVRRPDSTWDPQSWDLAADLPLESHLAPQELMQLRLSTHENRWLDAWDDFVASMRADGVARLPGFPIWVDAFVHRDDLSIPISVPGWKAGFLRKNSEFYTAHREAIEAWLSRWDHLRDFPTSRRKLEWQAQDAASLADTIIHLRPSGVRVKKATYTPALVAITQTTILGDQRRRLSKREVARLQGFPDSFTFGSQRAAACYKQVGNGVNVGVAYHALRSFVHRVAGSSGLSETMSTEAFAKFQSLARSIRDAPLCPPHTVFSPTVERVLPSTSSA